MTNNNPPQPPDLKMQRHGDGFLFELRDGVHLWVRWNSSKTVECQMWQGTTLLAPDIGNLNSSGFRKRLSQSAKDAFGQTNGKENAPHVAEDIDRVAAALRAPQAGGKTLSQELEEQAGRSVTEKLISYARANARFFHNADREAYATVTVGDHRETYRVRSRDFRLWVRHIYWNKEKARLEEAELAAEGALFEGTAQIEMPDVVREQNLADAVMQLETISLFEGPEEEVHVRVAGHEGRIYLDLADEEWRVIEITSGGWQIIPGHEAPVKFVRKPGMLGLPTPVEGGNISALRKYINMGSGEEGERNWRLVVAWLVQALMPRGPYAVLVLMGNQGSAKSTTHRILRRMVDPNTTAIRAKPREERDLFIAATNGWCVALDNMSGISEWLSDALCRLSTGGGFSTRRLHSNDEEQLFDAMRPICINGIGDVATRPDLLDRSLIVNLPDIGDEDRREEDDLYAAFEEEQPEILGTLLTAATAYLRNAPEVKLASRPRMADFARVGVATEEALGGEKGSFLKAYEESRGEATETALEVYPIVSPLWEFAKSFDENDPWAGAPSDLFDALNDRVGENDVKRSQLWPKQASALSAQLNRLAPSLRAMGVHVNRTRVHGGRRQVEVFYKKSE